MVKVSIVIPVYNVEKYLEKCLDSVCRQSLKDIEIICVNDGSTDGSTLILDSYAQRDKRIKVIHKTNSGYGHTMNVGIDAATGNYIGIVESDDWIKEDMYESLYKLATNNNLDFIKSDFYEFIIDPHGENLTEYKKLSEDEMDYGKVCSTSEELRTFHFLKYTWSGIYKRQFLINNNIRHNETPGASYQDNGFWFQTFIHGKRVMFLDKAFYMYKQDNPNSSIHSTGKLYAISNEFDFIENILHKMDQSIHKYIKLSAYFRINDEIGNIERIADEYKLEYLNKIKNDYLLEKERGILDLSDFENWQREIILSIVENCDDYCKKLLKHKQLFMDMIKPFKEIIVYGAGNCGRSLPYLLGIYGLNRLIKYFVVTSAKNQPQHINLIPIYELDTIKDELKNAMVILAVVEGSERFEQMRANLSLLGVDNIISYREIQEKFAEI